jgi:hypothetical protein
MLLVGCAFAADPTLADRVRADPRFQQLGEEQRAWLSALVGDGLVSRPLPGAVYAYSLGPIELLAQPSGGTSLLQAPPLPHAVQHGSDFGGNLTTLPLLAVDGPRWQVELGGVRGWLAREALRVDAVVVTRADGSYLREVVPDCSAGGSRCRMRLGAVDGAPVISLRYVRSYRGEDEAWFVFAYDPASDRFTDWVDPARPVAPAGPLNTVVGRPTLDRIRAGFGFDRPGYSQLADGSLVERSMFYAPLTDAVEAVAVGGWVLFDSSIHGGVSPLRPN